MTKKHPDKMEIKGSKFILRSWRAGDEDRLVEIANNKKIWINLNNAFPHPYTMESAKWWVNHCQEEDNPNRIFAIEVDGKLAGCIDISPRPPESEHCKTAIFGYWLGEEYWGRGIASEAVKLIVDYGFKTFDIVRIQAGIFSWNPASARVLEKNGFTLEGRLRKSIYKDGKICDEMMYSKLKEED